ncbi:MAG: DUF411 domain-containing protein [Aquabacterium sp.]|jgi:hypothetical protein|uniref:DUF411 domain-containing protein n=1 Tax=Aquabacterium sp. TaxID=1872578 RepID=UPI002A36CD1B|nr:DUF411 domain-containing protein [Aquabacterium sp.]MDX9844888.1 DUF411 domain-containing protein [Aquabacterium sp.]
MNPSRRNLLLALAATPAALLAAQAQANPFKLPTVQVWKSPTCGCCTAWVEHMRNAGFTVNVSEVDDTSPTRKRLGMPAKLGSCHTALVGGYVLEGHVPADDVKRLLRNKTAGLGLSVPGMPVGSPGMEMGPRLDPYDVLLVQRDGSTSVFSHYPKAKPQA